jgi:hypothetical protein
VGANAAQFVTACSSTAAANDEMAAIQSVIGFKRSGRDAAIDKISILAQRFNACIRLEGGDPSHGMASGAVGHLVDDRSHRDSVLHLHPGTRVKLVRRNQCDARLQHAATVELTIAVVVHFTTSGAACRPIIAIGHTRNGLI